MGYKKIDLENDFRLRKHHEANHSYSENQHVVGTSTAAGPTTCRVGCIQNHVKRL